MRLGKVVFLLLALAASPAQPQTAREAAVAIDRVPVPPVDRYGVERIASGLAAPWSLAFLPDGRFLVSEKHGGLRIVAPDGSVGPVLPGGPPNVLAQVDSGLLDVVLDPDFAENRFVYVAFAQGTEEANRTAVWKARLADGRLADGRVIFHVGEDKRAPSHPGGRMLFLPDKTLLLAVGDGYDYRDKAQDPASHLGKVLRLTRDGQAPPDNPFVARAGYAPEIWTLGTRNIQGLTRDPASGTVWAHEHGPRGGDEINRLVAGANYGWPRASFGIDYDGTLITSAQHVDGMADPAFVWSPSIAPSGLAVYHGALFPELEGRLLAGSMAFRALVQVREHPETRLLAEEGRWLVGLRERIRDVRVSPAGEIYLITDHESGALLRLVPPAADPFLDPSHPLTPLAFLVGEWTGESVRTPFAGQDTPVRHHGSNTSCKLILGNAYLRCASRLRDQEGSEHELEHFFRKGSADPSIQVRILEDGWAGDWVYYYTWNESRGAFVAEHQGTIAGQPVIERTTLIPAPDGATLTIIEEGRLANAPDAWQPLQRWTWTRR